MADILTQLQDALDILLKQFYAGLIHTSTRHPYGDIPDQPHDADRDINQPPGLENGPASAGASNPNAQQSFTLATQSSNANAAASGDNGAGDAARPRSPPPDPDFAATQHEIASDIIMNMARIQALIDRLPGIGFSENEQVARMRELDGQLREEDVRLQEAVREKERLLKMVDERIMRVRRP